MDFEVERLEPLFSSEDDFREFKDRHDKHQVPVKDLASYQGNVYLASMPVLPLQRLLWSAKTEHFFIPSTMETTEDPLAHYDHSA